MYTSRSLLSQFASCLSLITLVASYPANDQGLSFSKQNATIEQGVFFGISGAKVQEEVARLKAEGYRPKSLSIHGSPADAKYTGIWTKEDGNEYETILGANESTYNAWMEHLRANVYVSTHISATGSASDALFAGVMQQIPSVQNWVQQCGLDSPWSYENATMNAPMIIKGVSMYGVPGKRQYCILGHENRVNHQQMVWYETDSYQDNYKVLEAAEASKRFWRPVFLDSSEDQIITPIFDDTSVGKWAALGICIITGAGGAESRYAVIFAERTTPLDREWHTTGTVTGYIDNAGASDALDQVMRDFMSSNSVRQAQVAASINGTIVASRAYTWAENDRAVVKPSDKFLLGSVSKTFTYAATNHLISTGLLNLTTLVYPLFGYNDPADKRSLDITVQHLLDHTAGFDRNQSPDIGFIFTAVAQSLNQATPATLRQIIEYIVAQPLDYTPGESLVYSNYGTMLLSYVITNLTGESYTSYIEKNVLDGADVELWETAADAHLSDPIIPETKYTAISALLPLSQDRVLSAHGGDGSIKEEAIGAFGLRASAATISQFIGKNAVYGLGGRQSWSYRDGTVDGARAIAYSMDQLDWALTLNTREYANEAAWSKLVFEDVRGVWDRFSLAE